MKKMDSNKLREVTGGALHWHWICNTHAYTSVARTYASCLKYKNAHNETYHNSSNVAKMDSCNQTTGNCSVIYQN